VGDRFYRACPEHGARVGELAGGDLRCGRGHLVGAWLVIDAATGGTVAAGRVTLGPMDAPPAVWFGPWLQPLARSVAALERSAA
jgi:hypothetical protein